MSTSNILSQLGSPGVSTGFKNRIINGAMTIDQRNAGASVTPAVGNFVYTLDRWAAYVAQSSKLTVQQSTTAPAGFTNSIKVTSSSAYSVGASETFFLDQPIEGFNIADLGWGSANAKTVTLSFQVYSSLTGTFGGSILNGTYNRSYPFSYSIPVANTWTTVSVTIPGDTSGTWATTNGIGMYVSFSLGVGSTYSGTAGSWVGSQLWSTTGAVSVVGTNGATWYVTGVQLEVGTTATNFEYRQYTTELALCQRYFQWTPFNAGGYQAAGSNIIIDVPYKVTMRVVPSFAIISADPNATQIATNNSANTFSATYSGVDGAMGYLQPTATGSTQVLGYRSATSAEL